MILNCCLFCKIPYTDISIKSAYNVEGRQIVNVECTNCGAEIKYSILIERGPTKKHVVNERKEENVRTSNEGLQQPKDNLRNEGHH